ncbi:MAG: hypothetical protein IKI69_01035 [Oscillospiraceae bacterium]|nr:hypothetical protein [Oscillospiraceae bacterium]
MQNAAEKKRRFWLLWAIFAFVGLLIAAIVTAIMLFTARINGERFVRWDMIDARQTPMSVEEFERAQAKYPDDLIRWSVPLSGGRFDSFSEEIAVASLTDEDLALLHYLPNLKRIDARACTDYRMLARAEDALEEIELDWEIATADGVLPDTCECMEVHELTLPQLQELIELLPYLKSLDLCDAPYSQQEIDALMAANEELAVRYTVHVWGLALPSDSESIRPADGQIGDLEELKDALGRMTQLKQIDLTDTGLTPEQLAELLPYFDGREARYEIQIGDHRYEPDSELIDLSGEPFRDFETLDAAIKLMPALKKVDMCDCGLSNEEMDALNRRYESVQFVWRVYFDIYSLRTDTKVFCASDLPELSYLAPELTDWELAPIKYCTELVALDLGHMQYTDISFLYEMLHLKYLILVESHLRDITPIGSLEELEYLEMFINSFPDISPLTNCKKLKHLNICYTYGYDGSPLKEMTWLERLWCVGGSMSGAMRQEIIEALPNTVCYMPYGDPQGSTGGGWRECEAYYDMRDMFGMYYQPGGTGIH